MQDLPPEGLYSRSNHYSSQSFQDYREVLIELSRRLSFCEGYPRILALELLILLTLLPKCRIIAFKSLDMVLIFIKQGR
jgi:hypothetical protein